MSGGSSSGKSFGTWIGKGRRKGPPIVWEASLGPIFFQKVVYEFPVESKSDFTNEYPLRRYDNSKEDWSKCMHGEDCLVRMCTKRMDGACHFFKCP